MYNHNPKSNSPFRKNHKTVDRKGEGGGVNPYGQPDRKISGFFLTASLREAVKKSSFLNFKIPTPPPPSRNLEDAPFFTD